MQTLEQEITTLIKYNQLPLQVKSHIKDNLNEKFLLRPYQEEALSRFIWQSKEAKRIKPTQLLFHMATGSGKTLIMAGCILHLYEQGYRNFIFFVNSSTIIEKTKDNFLNVLSPKYLFSENIFFKDQNIKIRSVENFQAVNSDEINILFTTIQGLHTRLNVPRENSITYEDFENKDIILISDEAHHINAETKKGKLTDKDKSDITSWENTVNKIFKKNSNNYLLEFTATVDLENELLKEKYANKLIFDYPLKNFRKDKYSKEVKVFQVDFDPYSRALHAVILSQYRRKMFEKNGLHIKPVILMKSKTIAESRAFFAEFIDKISLLDEEKLESINSLNRDNIISEAFSYFKNNEISFSNFISEIKEDFAKSKCMSIDSKSDNMEKQLIVNNLEDPNNEFRVIFAVDKLNEGWDVLNLFDIVRLYNTRDANHRTDKVGKTTMSEAQLIGRGARYCPFRVSNEQEFFQRKYDDDLANPLRVCEELYYHSVYNPKYIFELNKALEQIGIKDSRIKELPLFIKDNIKNSDFFKNSVIYLNQKIENKQQDNKNILPIIINKERVYRIKEGFTTTSTIFEKQSFEDRKRFKEEITFEQLSMPLKRKALNKLKFYKLKKLKWYYPHLGSMNEFITSENYLNPIKIIFEGVKTDVENLSEEMKLNATVEILALISSEIQNGVAEYKGTSEFKPVSVKNIFKDKLLNIAIGKQSAEFGIAQSKTHNDLLRLDISSLDWYAFNENYGTDQEKYLVKNIYDLYRKLESKYSDIHLFRNENHFKIYSFENGEAFAPDFVLFLKKKSKEKATVYQMFIEPKGQHYTLKDEWKEMFLKQIEKEYKIEVIFEDKEFKIIGLPFYNEETKKQEFNNKLKHSLSLPGKYRKKINTK